MVVGLTGGIGSGKSTVARMLRELGAAVVDADALAREAVEPGRPAHRAVVDRFGAGVVLPDGTLDRKRLGAIVFADASARRDLERIVHPEVAALAAARFAEAVASGAPLVVYDVPLLFENQLEGSFSSVIVVRVSPSTQRARIAARDRLSEDEVRRRIEAQMPLEEKVRRAQHVIDNDGDLDATRAQVEALVARLVNAPGDPAPEAPRRVPR